MVTVHCELGDNVEELRTKFSEEKQINSQISSTFTTGKFRSRSGKKSH